MLAQENDQPVKRYLKCIKQKAWAEAAGLRFHNMNGDYNFYCYWRSLKCQLVPREVPVVDSSTIAIATNFVLQVRQEIRSLVDRHVVRTATGRYVRVARLDRDAYFKSMQSRPIYASLDHLRAGILAGAVERSRGPTWLVVESREGDEMIRRLLYEMWSGFIGLYERLVAEVEVLLPQLSDAPLEIRLDFSALKVPEDHATDQPPAAPARPDVLVHLDQRTAVVRFPSDFLAHFQQPDNTGERLVLRALARGLVSLHQGSKEDVEETLLETLLDKVIGDARMRVLHLYHRDNPVDHLQAQQRQDPIFLAHEEFVFAKLRLSEGCTAIKPEAVIKTKAECNSLLHKVVEKIWGQLHELLRLFDRTSVIRQALIVHEAVIQDRDHWRRTAQAIIALYASAENVFSVAQNREQERSQVELSARIILEMAICECPISGGRTLSRWELDELLAKIALLIEAATDSDAIHSDLVEPAIQLHANGEYSIDRSFHEAVVRPFVSNYFREEFEGAAGDYGKLYRRERPAKRTRVDEIYSPAFIHAFKAEFGLTPDEAADGLAELVQLAVEGDSILVETTLGALRGRLARARGLSPDVCDAFVRTFGLFHRPAWDQPPAGFKRRDLSPWRYRRRLSAAVRPLLLYGDQDSDTVLYGVGGVILGFGYLLERTERGQLPEEFFTTAEMRTYIGSVNHERGHAFAKSVGDAFREDGWQIRSEVQMSELGASPELGDIDVLAWMPAGEVLLIECKRLQLARTIAEIAEVCRRFRGEAKDELDKHVRRVNWVRKDPMSLERILGFKPDQDRIDARLVTDTHVPMMYLTSLPIQADKIGPLQAKGKKGS